MTSLTAEKIAEIQMPLGIRLSPDSKHVVYLLRPASKSQKNVQTSLWLADVGKENSARPITSGSSYDEQPRFSPDGKFIAFLSDRNKPGSLATLYHRPVDGSGEVRALTPTENEKPINAFQWSLDGECIAYQSADEKSNEVKNEEKAGFDAMIFGEDLEYARLRTVNVKTGAIKTLVSQEGHVGACCWSPDGDRIAYTLCKSPESDHTRTAADLHVIQIHDGKSYKVCSMTSGIRDLVWADDRLLWISAQDGRSKWTSLALWSSNVNADSQTIKLAYGDEDCAMRLQRCGKDAVVHVQRGMSDHLVRALDQTPIAQLETDLMSGWDVVLSNQEPVVAYMKGSIAGGEVVSLIGDQSVQLSEHENKEFARVLQHCETLSFEADDSVPLDGVLYQSSMHDPKDGLPATVVIPHGGPHWRSALGMDACWNWTPWLLAQGYTVMHPNYRGGSGHGAEFAGAVHHNAASSYQDVIALTNKCIEQGKMDPKRIAIAGWSQGGFLAYLAVTRSSTFHFAAAVAGAGVSCWDTMMTTSDVPIIESGLGGGLPWEISIDNITGRQSSALWHMQDVRTPLLILHGENDVRVPVSQARSFALGMRELGKPFKMITYPREGHGPMPNIFERSHNIHMLEALRDFLAKHLK